MIKNYNLLLSSKRLNRLWSMCSKLIIQIFMKVTSKVNSQTSISIKKETKVLVRFLGPNNLAVEDLLPFEEESKWFEVDSTSITFFIVDHQDESDTLEIINDLAEA